MSDGVLLDEALYSTRYFGDNGHLDETWEATVFMTLMLAFYSSPAFPTR